jgi:carboxyl-terminal processing protease
VRTHADSIEGPAADTTRPVDSLGSAEPRRRPEFRSQGGRVLYGGGGITPDVRVAGDTLTAAEQALREGLVAASGARVGEVFSRFALDLARDATPTFVVDSAWRAELYRRLTAAGARIDRARYDAAPRYVNLLLEQRVAQLAFGAGEARRRELASDTQFRAAYDLLRQANTQAALLRLGATKAMPVPG